MIVWDRGNNDLPFYRPDIHIVVVDPLRPGHEMAYHPGETNLRMADVVVVNKVGSADRTDVDQVLANVQAVNPTAVVIEVASPVELEPGPPLHDARGLIVEDGPTITHGGMPYGAGTVAARDVGVQHIIDPHPHVVGSIADTYRAYPDIGHVLPAMGYGDQQTRDLEATIGASGCDVVISGTPIDLGRLVDVGCPIRRATYTLQELGARHLRDALAPHVRTWLGAGRP